MTLVRTCTEMVMRAGAMNFCQEPAKFHYSGIVKQRPGETPQAALERRGRIENDLCLNHTRDCFTRMEPALRDGQVQLKCLEFTKLTLRCGACQSLFRLEPLQPSSMMNAKMPSRSNGYFLIPNHFCPNCGKPCVATHDPTLDWWELVIKAIDPENLNQIPVALIQEIYAAWQRDPTATHKFVEYVQAILAEVG